MSTTLFPTNLPGSEWVRFRAEGFPKPVCGVIYRLEQPASNGLPLGSVDTGCIDLETSGLWGYSTIFNTHVPRMGPLNLPFLGIHVGGASWVLCDPTQIKPYSILQTFGTPMPFPPGFPQCGGTFSLEGVRTAKEIHYWGHYPVADLEYETDAPIGVGLRAWTSFLPGNIKDSLIPGAVFEVHLRNISQSRQEGTLAFSFPGPTEGEVGEGRIIREKVHGSFHGIHVKGPKASYTLGVIGSEQLRMGGELGTVADAWARIDEVLPDMIPVVIDRTGRTERVAGLGASAAVGFDLHPGEQKVVRFVLAWHSPQWRGGGYNWSEKGHTYTHMYAKHYLTAVHAAGTLSEGHETLLKRILAWQQAVYTDS